MISGETEANLFDKVRLILKIEFVNDTLVMIY